MSRLGLVLARIAVCTAAATLVIGGASARADVPAATFPLHVDTATRTLVGANGQPFLLEGDAAWSLIVQLNQTDMQQYLSDRQAKGFNAVLVNLIEHQFSSHTPPSANAAGQQPFLRCLPSTPGCTMNNDFTAPNSAYFDYAETVVAEAQARQMLVLLAPMYLGYQGGSQGWYADLKANGPTAAQSYGNYIGTRFARYTNIIWVQGGDTALVDPSTGVDATAEINALVAGIRQADTVHLATAEGTRGDSALDDYAQSWLTLDTVYTDCAGAQTKARSEWARATNLPFFHIEGIYENEPVGSPVSDQCLLNQMYYPVLLGARGHVFGNRPIWLFDTGWQSALNSPGSLLMQNASTLLRSHRAASLVPDTAGRIVVSGGGTLGTDDFAAAGTTPTSVLVYVPTGPRTLQIDTSQLPGTQASAGWFDVRTGQQTSLGTINNGATRSFTTPAGSGPWVLVLDNPAAVSQPVWHPFFAVDPHETPMVGDFNGDGKMDIITFTRDNPLSFGDVYVALSNGHEFVDHNGTPGLSDKWNDWFAISPDQTVVIGDFDGDGKDDIATWLGTTSRQVYVARSTGNGMTASTVWLDEIGFDPTDVLAVGDVNGDGKKDLVLFARKQGKVYVALSDGTKFLPATVWHNFFAVSTYERPRVADVNGDGKADIVTFCTNSPTAFGDVYVAVSDGTRFVDQNGVPDNSTKWSDWFSIDPTQTIRIGDLDGDRKDDFFTFLQPFAQAYTVESTGTAMGPNVLWPEQVAGRATDEPWVGDVDGDGKADIIIFARSEGKVYVSLAR